MTAGYRLHPRRTDKRHARYLLRARRDAQYVRIRSITAARSCADMPLLRGGFDFGFGFGCGFGFGFGFDFDFDFGFGTVTRLDVLAAAFAGGASGAMSMSNIPDRSSPASTFVSAGRFALADSPAPAFAIKPCCSTWRNVNRSSG